VSKRGLFLLPALHLTLENFSALDPEHLRSTMASLKSNFLVAITLLLRTVVCQTDSVDYCVALGEVLQICEQETPGFTDMAATQQASCACGNSIGTIPWGPATFDSLAASCAVQYATIDTDIASGASQLIDFCTDYDVQATTSTTSSATVRTTVSLLPSNYWKVSR